MPPPQAGKPGCFANPSGKSMSGIRLPHLIPLLLTVALLAAGLLAGAGPALAAGCPGADKGPRQISNKTAAKAVACLVNKKRRSHGKRPFNFRRNLARAARSHSKRMQKTDCFDHVCPGERSLPGRYERADYLPCSCSWGAAENIAWGAGRNGTPRKIVKAWMHSHSHRVNILGNFEDVGVGVRWGSPNKRGAHAGTYTLDFGFKR